MKDGWDQKTGKKITTRRRRVQQNQGRTKTPAEGVTGTSTPYFGKCDLVEVGGSAPGLRAFRMNPGRTEESHGMPDASYVGERSTSQEGRIPYHAESGASSLLGMQRVVGKQLCSRWLLRRRNQCMWMPP